MRGLVCWLIALSVVCGACTPEAIEVDPAAGAQGGAAPSAGKSSSGGHVTTGAGGNSTNENQAGDATAGEAAAGEAAGGTGGGGAAGGTSGGSGGTGGKSPDCAPLQSPQSGCEDCLAAQCQSQLSACQNSLCLCKPFMSYTGQMNCLLACLPAVGAMQQQADLCAKNCGFQSLMYADKTTHELFDCLVNPPMGPPRCPQCLGK